MRRILFIFATSIIVVFLVIVFVAMSFFQGRQQQNTQVTVLPTKAPEQLNSPSNNQTIPLVRWDKTKADKLVNAATNKQSLSVAGAAAKQKLINSLGNTSGTVYTNANISIDYIKSPDIFQVQINTPNSTQAKQEAVNWMISQGFTQDDVCRLPLAFYLSSQASQSLRNTNTVFNPLPDGC